MAPNVELWAPKNASHSIERGSDSSLKAQSSQKEVLCSCPESCELNVVLLVFCDDTIDSPTSLWIVEIWRKTSWSFRRCWY